MTQTATRIALAKRPEGAATLDCFRAESFDVPTPGAGEFVVRTIWMSLDPYMRGRMDDAKSYADPVPLGGTMEAGAVGEVIASEHPGFPVGTICTGRFGWTTHAVSDGEGVRVLDPDAAPLQTNLGALGMPGMTAWVGLTLLGRPRAGETLVVGAATGAVGTVVGQLAKARGLRAVGVAGGAEKCRIAVEELGFDACVDHKAHADAASLRRALKEVCPGGVDIYFENVGGKTLEAVMPLMNPDGRIPVCGMISWYDAGNLGEGAGQGPLAMVWSTVLRMRLQVQGFIVSFWFDRFGEFLAEAAPMVGDGRIRVRETVAEGLEAAPQAFLDLLKGGNTGKQLVRVGPDPAR